MKTVPSYIPPTKARIAIVGEAPGTNEVRKGRPFVGYSGRELNKLLRNAGIERANCFVTNVFDFQLPDNDLGKLAVNKKTVEGLVDLEDKFAEWPLTYVTRGQYVPPEICYPALERLQRELKEADPNIIIALGGTALWALMCGGSITKERGHLMSCKLVPGLKVMPTFHPAYLVRMYKARVTMLTDLANAERQSYSKEVIYTKRRLVLNPTLADLEEFYEQHIKDATYVSADIETFRGQVECIGFAPNPRNAIVVPFVDRAKGNASYWENAEDELAALEWCRRICEDRALPKLMQNGTYDVQWLWVKTRIKTYNYSEDTRLQHHALYPELPKSLQYLGSTYENEQAWKTMRGNKDFKRDA